MESNISAIGKLIRRLSNLVDRIYAEGITQDTADEYDNICKLHKELLHKVSHNEKDYILSQFVNVSLLDSYSIPVLKMSMDRMKERYSSFYYPSMNNKDILTIDVNESTLPIISDKYFSAPFLNIIDFKKDDTNKIIEGIRYGDYSRLLFKLPICKCGSSKAVECIFLLDTGSRSNYISSQALKRMNVDTYGVFSLEIYGFKTKASESPETDSRLSGVNLLGDEFLMDSKAKIIVDYSQDKVIPRLEFNI